MLGLMPQDVLYEYPTTLATAEAEIFCSPTDNSLEFFNYTYRPGPLKVETVTQFMPKHDVAMKIYIKSWFNVSHWGSINNALKFKLRAHMKDAILHKI